MEELFKEEDDTQKANFVKRRGGTLALVALVKHFGENLPANLPKLWEYMIGQLTDSVDPFNFNSSDLLNKDDKAEELLWALQVSYLVEHLFSPSHCV